MKIKKNDQVKIIRGKDRGKTGKVLNVMPMAKKLVVEGLNILTKNARAKKSGDKGQRIQFPAPLDIAKVMLICPHCGNSTKVGYQIIANKGESKKKTKKVRICRKCKEVID